MCGIFGQIGQELVSGDHLLRQLRLLAHRGPDGAAVALFEDGTAKPKLYADRPARDNLGTWKPLPDDALPPSRIALGHLRLAIVELSDLGRQPMASADDSLWIVFNGEIYNHVELREDLEVLGHKFTSHSDTEVILAAYLEWGVDCLSRFNGMWAFCLLDRNRGKIFFARDRFGVKPLYFWKNRRNLYFSSEIKAFMAVDCFSFRPSSRHMMSYLENGPSECEVETMFLDVVRLEAASFVFEDVDADFDPVLAQRRWWSLEIDDSKETFDPRVQDRLSNRYFELLKSAVSLRLRADVEVGSALSGGLDSSSVVYLAAELLKAAGVENRQHSFSSVYRSSELEACDESHYIELMAGFCGVRSNTIEPMPSQVPDAHRRMIWHLDTPPDSTLMSSWHTFQLVKQTGIKVTLDGQGADEQLAGYLFYLPHRLCGYGLADLTRQFSAFLTKHPARIAVGALLLAGAAQIAPSKLGKFLHPRHRLRMEDIKRGANWALRRDSGTNLANLIHYADRTSMAFSIESRMPFLDFRLAEFLAKVPECYKIHNGWTKALARSAFSGKLPNQIVWRKDKLGWPIPEKQWSDGPLRDWFERALDANGQSLDEPLAQRIEPMVTKGNIEQRVRVINLFAWLDTFGSGNWRQFEPSRTSANREVATPGSTPLTTREPI